MSWLGPAVRTGDEVVLLLKLSPLFALSAVLESVAHICLKKASLQNADESGLRYYVQVMKSFYVWMGIISYLTEMFAWLFILSKIPLSIAFPASGLQKIVMVFFAVWILREPLNRREAFALALIGVGLVCAFLAAGDVGAT